ncbi:hypothetical protein B0H19DRAFT_1072506 [Mycena capillaripes]|nr:hypothetical protein B0H19DRAFT_1072506 [Mycena capillaripes]
MRDATISPQVKRLDYRYLSGGEGIKSLIFVTCTLNAIATHQVRLLAGKIQRAGAQPDVEGTWHELTDEVNTLAANLRTQESGFDSGPLKAGSRPEAPEMVQGQRRIEGGRHLKMRGGRKGTKSRCREEVRTHCDGAFAQVMLRFNRDDRGRLGARRGEADRRCPCAGEEVSLRLSLRAPSRPGLTGEEEVAALYCVSLWKGTEHWFLLLNRMTVNDSSTL